MFGAWPDTAAWFAHRGRQLIRNEFCVAQDTQIPCKNVKNVETQLEKLTRKT